MQISVSTQARTRVGSFFRAQTAAIGKVSEPACIGHLILGGPRFSRLPAQLPQRTGKVIARNRPSQNATNCSSAIQRTNLEVLEGNGVFTGTEEGGSNEMGSSSARRTRPRRAGASLLLIDN